MIMLLIYVQFLILKSIIFVASIYYMCLHLCINLLRAYCVHLCVLKLLLYIDYNVEHMPVMQL